MSKSLSRHEPASEPIPSWASALAVGGTFALLLYLENRRPLRASVESKWRRDARNLAVAATEVAALQLCDAPITRPLSRLVERRRWGLTHRLGLPPWARTLTAWLLLDYSLYWWHRLFHRVPLLWRLHQVHHVDLDMDASTGVRFHAGEMVLSALLRAAQVPLLGVTPRVLSIWDTWLLCEVMFHHSNVRLPHRVERWLAKLIVTPRMHGIHHSVVPSETDSNWSSGLTLWDRLHGTLRLNVPQRAVTIGVPAYREPGDVALPKLLTLPLQPKPHPERLPGGRVPQRDAPARVPRSELLP